LKIKICKTCGKTLPITEFTEDTRNKDGVGANCKLCIKIANAIRYKNDKPRLNALSKQWRLNNINRHKASQSLKNHRLNGNITEITIDELTKLYDDAKYCPICGVKLKSNDNGKTHPIRTSPSIDRIDNEKTLTVNNVWILCHKCNSTKLDRTMKEFYDYCKGVTEKFKSEFEGA